MEKFYRRSDYPYRIYNRIGEVLPFAEAHDTYTSSGVSEFLYAFYTAAWQCVEDSAQWARDSVVVVVV